jgi:hypothetical protein
MFENKEKSVKQPVRVKVRMPGWAKGKGYG